MKIRAKHGPHMVVIDVASIDDVLNVFVYAMETLNKTYGLKLLDVDGITLEALL